MAVNRPGEVYSDSELERILEGAREQGGFLGKRNYALIKLLVDSGVRAFELTAITLKDLDLEHFAIRVRHGKGDKARVVGVSRSCRESLQQWLRQREELGYGNAEYLFPSRNRRRMLESNLRKMLKRLEARIGLDHRLHPHGFRHTHARKLVTKNISIKTIQDQLGHNDLSTTQRYVAERFPYERTTAIADALG